MRLMKHLIINTILALLISDHIKLNVCIITVIWLRICIQYENYVYILAYNTYDMP